MDVAELISIDAGTTSVRCLAVRADGSVAAVAQREFGQHYPRPGWVEHDAAEIWTAIQTCLGEVLDADGVERNAIKGIGITNQRETVVAWSRRSGEPRCNAIVWQDRRTAERCAELTAAGAADEIRRITGLVIDPYFSGTKMEWMLREGWVADDGDLAFGTIDSWLTYKLSGGTAHVTDASNASRTQLFDLATGDWSPTQLARYGIPTSSLPTVVDSSGIVATTDPDAACGLRVPVAGMAGDQQSALFGQACTEVGMAKNTYGTGSFVLVNAGRHVPPPTPNALSTVAWRLGGETTYALEGSVFVSGRAIKWLRDELGVIRESSDTGPLAASVPDAGGVVLVPAFAGLGAPYWEPDARGAVFGLSRGITRAHLARAVVEAMAYQTRDVVDAMNAVLDRPVLELRVDGGAAVMDILCEIQAAQLGVDVVRPANTETTALGAAYLAGLATGVWSSVAEVAASWRTDKRFVAPDDRSGADTGYAQWQEAVRRVIAEARPAVTG